jgi:hypothetical protein
MAPDLKLFGGIAARDTCRSYDNRLKDAGRCSSEGRLQ